MKKVFLLVAIFLVGSATQTIAQNHQNVVTNSGNKHRYYNSQEIRFVEDGVLYTVSTRGELNFTFLQASNPYRVDRRNHNVIYYGNDFNFRRNYRARVLKDRFGIIHRVGNTPIEYKRNGKVKRVGTIYFQYHRGLLVQVGNMQITYNRRGEIRDTQGYVNRLNRKLWHDDWYILTRCETDYTVWNRNERIRERKVR